MSTHAIILSVGDELVLGQTIDTNSAYLSQQLSALGIATRYHQTVEDDEATVAEAIRAASTQASLIIITGGIGPTEDDLTRQALARAMNVPLQTDADSLRAIEAFFASRGRTMRQANCIQAQHPRTSSVIPNPVGTAPGIQAKLNDATIYVIPGVPYEMRYLYHHVIEPQLRAQGPATKTILTAQLNSFGAGESEVAHKLGDLMQRDRNPKVGTTVADGVCSVHIRAEFADSEQARTQLQRTIEQVRQRLGAIIYSQDEQTLAQAVVGLLTEQGKTVTTAESCTGGMIGSMLTDVAGASSVYVGGWVSYDNEFKKRELAVPDDLLAKHGAVIAPVAMAMARGALARSGGDIAIAITGIAGPDGGSDDKPVGTVWLALAEQSNDDAQTPAPAKALLLNLSGDRAAVRDRAAKSALQMLRLHLLDEPLDGIQWAVKQSSSPADDLK
jgi:nicotinamide-nucleotide amidase